MHWSKIELHSQIKLTSHQPSFFLLLLVLALLASCSKKTIQTVYPTLSDGRYDSEFPYRNCSQELDKISKTVKKLYCLVEYDQYFFNQGDRIKKDFLTDNRFKRTAFQKSFFSESVHGTATIIYNDNSRVAVLSCAHVVDYPDTIYAWFYDGLGSKTDVLESVSIKRKQQNFIRDLPGDGLLEIIAMDKERDIVFLGNTFDDLGSNIRTFTYPTGKAENLEWGSFVYILGFPGGHQMVTRGIVSNPNPGTTGEFLIDALFNPGVSGGIVLAVKDGVPNFELVGIARAVSAKYKNVIKPGKESHEEIYNPNVPYEGDVFVKLEKEIYYGVTFTIAIESVTDFYKKNRNDFVSRGYQLDNFFGFR